jgi:hypothetical protein
MLSLVLAPTLLHLVHRLAAPAKPSQLPTSTAMLCAQAVIKRIDPYIAMESFTPEAVAKVSKACTSICMWVRAMHVYHNVSLGVSVAPAAGKGLQRGEAGQTREVGEHTQVCRCTTAVCCEALPPRRQGHQQLMAAHGNAGVMVRAPCTLAVRGIALCSGVQECREVLWALRSQYTCKA